MRQLTILAVLILFISAMTVCPVMAEHVTSVPSQLTSQTIRDFSLDENDAFYVFTTIDNQQGIVHERAYGDEGLSRVEDVMIGDQCAVLVSDTSDQTVVAISGGYLLTFDKNQKLITLRQGSNEESSLVVVTNEYIDDALVPETQSDGWLSRIASLVPLSSQTIVKAGTLVCLTCVHPMLGAGYFVSVYLAGSVNAVVFAVVPVVVEVGDVVLEIAAGATIGAVSLHTLKEMCTSDTSGYRYFVSESMDSNQKQHFYKFRYKGNEKGTAEYVGEVNVADGVFTNLADTIIQFNGDTIEKIDSFKAYFGGLYDKFVKKVVNDFEYSKKNTATATAKWYDIGDIRNINKIKNEISEKEALEKLKKCKKQSIFIKGETQDDCKRLAKEASGNNQEPIFHNAGATDCEETHQYPHYHPRDANGKKCKPHCFWDPYKSDL